MVILYTMHDEDTNNKNYLKNMYKKPYSG